MISKQICFVILLVLSYPLLISSQVVQAEGDTATVQITGSLQPPGFSPALLTIHVNDFVIFINQSSPATTFAVSADNGSFSSPAIAPSKQWTVAFSNPGEYEYHATSAPKRMVGEILVVANSIALLPTPAPDIQSTAIAMIEAGKTPPDNLAMPTPTPLTPGRQRQPTSPLAGLWPPSPLLLVGSAAILLCLGIGSLFLARIHRRRLQKRKETDSNGSSEPSQAQTSLWQKWLHRFKKKDEDEDEEIVYEDE